MSFPSERTTLSIEEQRIRFEHSPLKTRIDELLRWRGTQFIPSLLQELQSLVDAIDAGDRDFLGYPVRERVHEPVG